MDRQLARHVVTRQPYNAETPLAALAISPTPRDLVYVRNHFQIPSVIRESWSLRIEGAVDTPIDLTLDELQNHTYGEIEMVLECAGNGRKAMQPRPPGTPWGLGAVSQVRFGGTRLAHLLEEAGPQPDAIEVVFTGADRGKVGEGRQEHFERSMPLDSAMEDGVLLAWTLNGGPLPHENGFPLRLVVGGWYGMASVKWLHSIRVVREQFQGYFQTEQYVYRGETGTPERHPVRHIRPRALISSPADGQSLDPGPQVIRGVAWSGGGPIKEVLVRVGKEDWRQAGLSDRDSRYGVQEWTARWTPPEPGQFTITARALDAQGHYQPLEPRYNHGGYGNNSVHSITVNAS